MRRGSGQGLVEETIQLLPDENALLLCQALVFINLLKEAQRRAAQN